MFETERKPNTARGKAGKGSKAACEAAGWKFAPLARIGTMSSTCKGHTTYTRYRSEGARGTMAIPPAGSGIEPRQFGGSGRAVAWAVEQLGQTARQPDDAPAGMAGIQILLTAALASGEICGGRDDAPERPDAELLTICKDALAAVDHMEVARLTQYSGTVPYGKSPEHAAWGAAFKAREQSLRSLPELHASTREGLLQKARTARLVYQCPNIPCSVREELIESLILDLIHLVPTLIDAQGRSVAPPAADAEGVA